MSIKGVDFVRLLNSESAQAPAASKGYLSASLAAAATSCTLEPASIGSTYPASGKAAIGKELVTYTRSGDVLTLARGVDNTTDDDHDADEVVQQVLEYTNETAADILNDLIVNYSPLDSSYIDLAQWQSIISTYNGFVYTAMIVEPTDTVKLINELIQQVGLVMFGNITTQKIHMDILRPVAVTSQTFSEDDILLDTFDQIEQPRRRFSQAWVFYDQRDKFEKLDEGNNFYSALVEVTPENLYETESVKKIHSRWIAPAGRTIAAGVAAAAIARYARPPKKFKFGLFSSVEKLALGDYFTLTHSAMQDCSGAQSSVNVILTGVTAGPAATIYEAEEFTYSEIVATTNKTILIDSDQNGVNLKTLYDSVYAEAVATDTVTFVIQSGVTVGGSVIGSPALDVGTWSTLPDLYITNNGYILGLGGIGTDESANGGNGSLGLYVREPVTIDNTNGKIYGGGGGGGGATENDSGDSGDDERYVGGNGAGSVITGGYNLTGQTGESTAGDGGDAGQDGTDGSSVTGYGDSDGGLGASAIDGDNWISWAGLGDIQGDRDIDAAGPARVDPAVGALALTGLVPTVTT
ncbi:hypothetical protein N9966_01000 [bacterium]|nr:hypothetical protein [bacterium]